MNEAETIAELIDPKVKEAGWGKVESSVVRREFKITNGEIKPGGIRAGIIRADYVLVYKNRKLAVIEAILKLQNTILETTTNLNIERTILLNYVQKKYRDHLKGLL